MINGSGYPTAFGDEPRPSIPALNAEGIRALNAGELDHALRCFIRSAHQANPANADVAFNLGLTYFRLGRYKDAIGPLRSAMSASAPSDKILYLSGVSFYQTGDFDGATEKLEILHHRNALHQDEILFLLEESYRRGKKPQQAKQCFAELANNFQTSCFFHKLMGSAYGEQGREDLALAEFKQAVAINGSIGDVHRAVGVIYLNRRDVAEASEWFKGELALNPCDPASHYYLGEIARTRSELPAATIEFKKAINCDANYPEGHLGMGLVLLTQHQNTRALEELRTAVHLEPDNSQAHYQLARCLRQLGRVQEAKDEAETIKRLEAIESAKPSEKLR